MYSSISCACAEEDAVAFGTDLLLSSGDRRLCLLLGLRREVTAELVGGLACLLDDAVGVAVSSGELPPVLGELLLGLCADLLRLLQIALDLP
jgi:hypothetical protein